jgi:hypothetical protein
MQLTKNFNVAELSRSEAATRKGVDNTPTPEAVENLRALAEKVLQPLRDAMGKPMRVNSAYRGPEANKAVGGSKTSQHMTGEAADIEFDGFDNKKLAQKIVDLKLPFDQIILEFYKDGDPNSGWVHVSHKRGGPQRGQVLRAVSEGGKTKYLTGLG